MRTHIIIHVDQRLGIMGENSKLAGLPIGKKPNIQVFFFNKISFNGFKEQLSPTPPFVKTILLQSLQFLFMEIFTHAKIITYRIRAVTSVSDH